MLLEEQVRRPPSAGKSELRLMALQGRILASFTTISLLLFLWFHESTQAPTRHSHCRTLLSLPSTVNSSRVREVLQDLLVKLRNGDRTVLDPRSKLAEEIVQGCAEARYEHRVVWVPAWGRHDPWNGKVVRQSTFLQSSWISTTDRPRRRVWNTIELAQSWLEREMTATHERDHSHSNSSLLPRLVVTGGLSAFSSSDAILLGSDALEVRSELLSSLPSLQPSETVLASGVATPQDQAQALLLFLRTLAHDGVCLRVTIVLDVLRRPRFRAALRRALTDASESEDRARREGQGKPPAPQFVTRADFRFGGVEPSEAGESPEGADLDAVMSLLFRPDRQLSTSLELTELPCLLAIAEVEELLTFTNAPGEKWGDFFGGVASLSPPERQLVAHSLSMALSQCGGRSALEKVKGALQRSQNHLCLFAGN